MARITTLSIALIWVFLSVLIRALIWTLIIVLDRIFTRTLFRALVGAIMKAIVGYSLWHA